MIPLTDEQIREISGRVEPDDLPGDLPEVAELIGTFNALLLGYHMGCGRIYLKPWLDDQSVWAKDVALMVRIIGKTKAQTVIKNFSPFTSGTHIYIPKCDIFWKQWRNKIICDSLNIRQIDLGRMHNLTDRQIRTIQKKKKASKKQQDLFI